ncbi:MAG: NAD-dependent epimerase/dehydratase family protein [Lachnospiraceae bacterium]|nr:NAD-dependent epimerase/dehydratase family protein [Lachnospiraceae bacterium]
MNALILGAGGFIGTNLTQKLKNLYKITAYDCNISALERLYKLTNGKINIISGNLLNDSNLKKILQRQNIIYHLVSTTIPATSNKNISQEICDNVEAMAKFLNVCSTCSVNKIVFLSSGGTIYGMQNSFPIQEDAKEYPISSYGVQKLMNEKLIYLYHFIYGLDYRIIRLSNPYGPYQNPRGKQGIVTKTIYKALKGEEIEVFGDGSIIRDYLYIDDAIDAIVKITEGNTKERLFNVGCGIGTSLIELFQIIEESLGIPLQLSYLPDRNVDVPVNYLNIERYKSYFGEISKIGLEDGIKKTADYLKIYMKGTINEKGNIL